MKNRSTTAVGFALKAIALASACLWGSHAAALGLGRLNVLSALGETLRAEVEVTSITPEEAATLALRVAPPEAYRAAGVEYNAVLPSANVQLQRRPDGRSFLRIASDRAVLEPFVDVIIEANWASGRLVREYTMLFDPPGSRLAQTPATPGAAAAIGAAPLPANRAPAPAAAGAPAAVAAAPAARPAPAPRAAPAPAPVQAQAAAPAPAPARRDRDADYRVKRGDTLTSIATLRQRPGVSLDQMLVGLFRSNPEAFMEENMNRMRAGAVLSVPSASELNAIEQESARQIIATQATDFNAYRQRLAEGARTVASAEPARRTTGRVQATVDDKQAAAPTADKLKLSQGSVGATATESKAAEKKADDARLAELARNVEELKKLQGSSAPGAAAGGASRPAGPGPTVVAAAPAPATTPAPAPSPTPAPAPEAAPPVAAVASAPEMPAAPVVVATPPTPASAVAAAPPAEPATPGLLDSLSENSLLLPAAGVLIALLGGLGLYRMRSRMRKPAGETSFLESRLQPDSFFGASGGQRVDTHEAAAGPASSSMSYSLSQLDAIGDVDPVAEADVYLAYGRDLQAEEILKEAMRSSPERMAVRTKLLEVYAKRRDTKGFELLATQVHNLTGGAGEDWAKAQELGLGIDPENPLYLPGGAPEEVRGNKGNVVEALGASTMPFTAPVSTAFQPATDAQLDEVDDLDLELPMGDEPAQALGTGAEQANDDGGLDFDLGDEPTNPNLPGKTAMSSSLAGTLAAGTAAASGFGGLPARAEPPPATPAPAAEELDFDLGALSDEGPATLPLPADTHVDFGDFDLDAPAGGADTDPLARKLELADEFRQIGDLEGARDLLEEVVAKASGVLKNKAQGMLDQLG